VLGSRATSELASAYEMSASAIMRDVTLLQPERQRAPDRSSWTAAFVLGALLIVPVALVLLAAHTAHRLSHPSEEELMATFLSHEGDFLELAQMLDSDHKRLSLAGEAVELSDLGTAGASATRIGHYESLLGSIDVKSFRYFPRSGNIILAVAERSDRRPGCSMSYRYLPRNEPQRLVYHRGYRWRGPGIYVLTGDRRIKGQWFIHHDTTLGVGVSPY
jgi:hypothetical protein